MSLVHLQQPLQAATDQGDFATSCSHEHFEFQDLLDVCLDQAAGVDNVGKLRRGLAAGESFLSSFQALVVSAAYARRNYRVRCMQGQGGSPDLTVSAGAGDVPVIVAGHVNTRSVERLADTPGPLHSACSRLPEGRGGVLHLFLPSDEAYELFVLAEPSYRSRFDELLASMPRLNALVLESVQPCPWTGRTLHNRYVVPNPGARYPLPEKFSLALSGMELPATDLSANQFTVCYYCMVPPYPLQLGGRMAELNWLSSPDGTAQLRTMLLPGGALRVELMIPGLGRRVVTIQLQALSYNVPHQFRLALPPGLTGIEVEVNGWRLPQEAYSIE